MVAEIATSNPVEQVVSEVGSHLLDYSARFAKGFVDGGIERPINGIAQVASLGNLPQLDLVHLDEKATGPDKWAQDVGSAAGQIFDFVVLSKLVGSAASSLGAPATALTTRLGTSALTGFLSGSVLTPLKPGESQWNRLGNGASQAASFMAMDGISSALGPAFGAPTLLNSIARGGISGAGGGVVFANMDSLTHGNGLASGSEILEQGTSWGTGGALMGGLGYGFSKLVSKDTAETAPKSEVGSKVAYTAEGEQAKISVSQLDNGKTQIDSVDLPNGTRLVREGANKWVTNPDSPEHQVWLGDVRQSDTGVLQYVYKFAKAPDVVTVDVRLPDGSRVAMPGANGDMVLPESSIDITKQTLADGALSSLRKLNLDVPQDRLKIEGATTTDVVSTNYSVQLTAEEAAMLRQNISTSGAQIVPAGTVVSLPKSAVHTTAIGENAAGEYVYDQPMADHTSTVSFLFKGDDERLKVVTGLRLNAPEKGKLALPGGFLDMDGKTVETPADAAVRETFEETMTKVKDPTLVRVGDSFNRDIRGRGIDYQWAVLGDKSDVAHLLTPGSELKLDDLARPQIRDVEELLRDPNSLAFDHYQALLNAYRNIAGSNYVPLGLNVGR